MSRTYPYTAWTLTPSFKPKQVTLVKAYDSYSNRGEWDVAEGGKLYSAKNDLFASKEDAIAAGWERIHEQEAKLSKMQAGIYKRRTALAAAAESEPA